METEQMAMSNPMPSLDVSNVHTELLQANRGLVESSSYRQSLGKLQSFLDGIPEQPQRLSHAAQATTEREMARALLLDSYSANNETVNTTLSPVASRAEERLVLSGLTIIELATVVAMFAGILTSNVPLIFLSLGICIPVIAFLIEMMNNEWALSTKLWRHRLFRRKTHQREMRRLLGEAEQIRQRRDRLKAVRKAKMEAAQKALAPISDDFSLANPGQKLAVVERDGKLSIDIAQDESYTPLTYMAARALAGREHREEQVDDTA